MNVRLCINVAFMLVFISGISSATTCSYDAYMQSCSKCPFDAYGKMNETCSDEYQSDAKTCLARDYPIMSGKYMFGSCPQIDECVSRLTACKEANRMGSNKDECSNLGSQNCFARADLCADAANRICSEGKTEEEAGWNNLDNATAPEPLEQNISNISQPNATQPDKYENMTRAQAEYNIEDFVCGKETFFILMLVLAVLFVRNN